MKKLPYSKRGAGGQGISHVKLLEKRKCFKKGRNETMWITDGPLNIVTMKNCFVLRFSYNYWKSLHVKERDPFKHCLAKWVPQTSQHFFPRETQSVRVDLFGALISHRLNVWRKMIFYCPIRSQPNFFHGKQLHNLTISLHFGPFIDRDEYHNK